MKEGKQEGVSNSASFSFEWIRRKLS
jgi:hypothetical protein